jgi:glycosyltransferase involved in cell wall biosynthesis
VVSFLTEELVRQGHEVTLFASGDSLTSARLVSSVPRSLRLDPTCVDQTAHHVTQVEEVFRRASEFDVIHFHGDYLHMPLASRHAVAHVSTLHGRLDLPDIEPLYRSFADEPVVSISDAQRAPLPFANWQATVYHGLPANLLSFHPGPGTYLAFLGRISPEKRVDRAIAIAKQVGIPLKIAAKVARTDQEYYDSKIRPLLDSDLVEFVGEIGERDKDGFLGGALALLFPIDWPEPFGLVMIEAMACGTPVIAFRGGSVDEVMEPGVSGFVVSDVAQAVRSVREVESLSRRACRAYFERRFTAPHMAAGYLEVYERLCHLSKLAPLVTANGRPGAGAAAVATTGTAAQARTA